MGRSFSFSEGEFYHLFNRGNEKRIIFKDRADKIRFQKILFLCNSTQPLHLSMLKNEKKGMDIFSIDKGDPLVDIGAYCILGNHFHLLVRERISGGISQFMQKLSTAYTMYFNIRNQRTGSLFEGRFRARHANHDTYLKYLFAYIHLNPVKHIQSDWHEVGIKNLKKVWNYLSGYNFSSLPDYMGRDRLERVILCKESFPRYFTGSTGHYHEIKEWLTLKPAEYDDSKFQG